MLTSWHEWPLLLFLTAVAYTDLRWRRVPNLMTGAVALLGLAGWTVADGWDGFQFAATGLLAGFILLLAPWFLGWVGGGDVKFLAAVGALGGAPFVLEAGLLGTVLGGVMALGILVRRLPLQALTAGVLGFLLQRAAGVPVRFRTEPAEQTTLPYAVALAGGALGALILRPLGWGW